MVAGTYEDFAGRLKEAIADQGGVSGAGKWLRGESLPGMENALLLATELGVCVEWLLTGRGPKKQPSSETVDLFYMVESLSPRERAIIARMLVYMSNSPPGRSFTYTEFLQIFKAAGASPADIARVAGPVQEGPKEVQS
jgi:hypothetical protein